MWSCKEVIRVMSSDEEMGPVRRLGFRLHVMFCRSCKHYAVQLKMMADGFKKLIMQKTLVEKEEITALENQVLMRIKAGL
jgi:hypothetical protein